MPIPRIKKRKTHDKNAHVKEPTVNKIPRLLTFAFQTSRECDSIIIPVAGKIRKPAIRIKK